MIRAYEGQLSMIHAFQQMGNRVSVQDSSSSTKRKRGRPKGSKDKNGRRCGRCKQYNGDNQLNCRGVGRGRKSCEYFFENGSVKKGSYNENGDDLAISKNKHTNMSIQQCDTVKDGEQKKKKMKMVQKKKVVDQNQLERDRTILEERIQQHNKQMQKQWDIIVNKRIDIHAQKCKLERDREQLCKERVQHENQMKKDRDNIKRELADIMVQKSQLDKEMIQHNEKVEVDRDNIANERVDISLQKAEIANERTCINKRKDELEEHRKTVEQGIAQCNRCLYLIRREQEHLNNTRLAFESRMDNFDLDFDISEHEIDE
jgi:chromosome segregation ATPase